MSSTLRARIGEVDYATAQPYDIAILIEQVFKDTAGTAEIGPVAFVQSIIEQYAHAVRQVAIPDAYEKMSRHSQKMKTMVSQLDEVLKRMDRDVNGSIG